MSYTKKMHSNIKEDYQLDYKNNLTSTNNNNINNYIDRSNTISRRNISNHDLDEDKKYQIRSMEELFIEDDLSKNKSERNVNDGPSEDNYEDVILTSFENLNLEDFKKVGIPLQIDIDEPVTNNFNEFISKNNEYDYDNNYNENNLNVNDINSNFENVSGSNIFEEEKINQFNGNYNLFNESREIASDVDLIESITDSLPVFLFYDLVR